MLKTIYEMTELNIVRRQFDGSTSQLYTGSRAGDVWEPCGRRVGAVRETCGSRVGDACSRSDDRLLKRERERARN